MTLPIWLPLDGHQDHLALIPISIWIQSVQLYEFYQTFDTQIAYIFQIIADNILDGNRSEVPTYTFLTTSAGQPSGTFVGLRSTLFNMEEIWGQIREFVTDENGNPSRRDFTFEEVETLMALVNEMFGITAELPFMTYPFGIGSADFVNL